MLDGVLAASAVGTPEVVGAQLRALVERTRADELILTSQIYDHAARLRSFELVQSVWSSGRTPR
jgi:alkanesulfonate monooxygenase SsuD/methylene tetrahydromethanopterin reductase-like flavin-dependent oxidoreductase (luciferase family)